MSSSATISSTYIQHFLNRYAIDLPGESISFYVHYWGVQPQHYSNPVHKHSFFEICYVLDGEGTYIEREKAYPLHKHILFCSRPGIPHQIRSETGIYLLYVAFEVLESKSTEEAIQAFRGLRETPYFYMKKTDDLPTPSIWSALIRSVPTQSYMQEQIAQLAHSLLISFQQTFSDPSERHYINEPLLSKESTTLLHQAQLYIQDNLSQPLRLDDVAGYLHISGRHLSRLFSQERRVSFSQYVRRARVEEAAALLSTTQDSIKKVAEETGFQSVHYFTRVFTKEMGIAPGRFREQYYK